MKMPPGMAVPGAQILTMRGASLQKAWNPPFLKHTVSQGAAPRKSITEQKAHLRYFSVSSA